MINGGESRMYCKKCGRKLLLPKVCAHCIAENGKHFIQKNKYGAWINMLFIVCIVFALVMFLFRGMLKLDGVMAEKLRQNNNQVKAELSKVKGDIELANTQITWYGEELHRINSESTQLKADIQELDGLLGNSRIETDIHVLEERQQEALFRLQDYLIFTFEAYYNLGIDIALIPDEKDIGDAITEGMAGELASAVLADVEIGDTVAEQSLITFANGLKKGKTFQEIQAEIMEQSGEWLSEDVMSYVGEQLLGSSVFAVLDSLDTLLGAKEALNCLVHEVQQKIEGDYFNCFIELLTLQEWDEKIYFECKRKSTELDNLIGELEKYTGQDFGSQYWFLLCCEMDMCIENYCGNDMLEKLYEGDTNVW